jgi:uncharacterized protein YdhG (YjbR/CyaY superfamily)
MPTSARTPAATAGPKVRAYLALQPPVARKALAAIRRAVRTVVPGATEHFSYGVPGFRVNDQPLVWYAGFRRHVSLYPMTAAVRQAHADAIRRYKTSTGTIQFPLDEPVPLLLIKRLVKARAGEVRRPRPTR